MSDIIEKLEIILQDRKTEAPRDSYVSSLYSKGKQDICDKIIEEAGELVDDELRQRLSSVVNSVLTAAKKLR